LAKVVRRKDSGEQDKWDDSQRSCHADWSSILFRRIRGRWLRRLPDNQGHAPQADSNSCADGSWSKAGAATAVVKPATLVLRFDSIDFDDGTAQLRTGKVANEVVVKMAEGYVHFMQVFRTGPLYTTTVFDKDKGGQLKAVHSRHEYFAVPLAGSTSSPEQYYGDCEVEK
jgi:hypothetical protein